MSIIATVLTHPPDADSPAQFAAEVSLPTGVGEVIAAKENCHIRIEVGPGEGHHYTEQIYGGPATSPVSVSIPPPADRQPRRVRAVAYSRDRDGIRVLDTSIPVTVSWPTSRT